MTLLLAVDPSAETAVSDTGWALLTFDETTAVSLVGSGVVNGGFAGFCQWDIPDADIVVVEHYVPFRAEGDPSPMLVEGALRYIRPGTVLQPASGKNTAVPDQVLRKLGVYSAKGHHADEREAIRHGVWYLKKAKHLPTLRKGWSK